MHIKVKKYGAGEQIHYFRDKASEKAEFVSYHEGVYGFCFTNKSPYYETVDFDVQAGHFMFHERQAKDGEQILLLFLPFFLLFDSY